MLINRVITSTLTFLLVPLLEDTEIRDSSCGLYTRDIPGYLQLHITLDLATRAFLTRKLLYTYLRALYKREKKCTRPPTRRRE